MADPQSRWPQNVPGHFYVDEQCLDHDLCRLLAPSNFRRNDLGGHYYVFKQPETQEEYEQCMAALEGCPVCAIGCDGVKGPLDFAVKSKRPWWRF